MKLWAYIAQQLQRHPGQVVCEDNTERTYEEMLVFAQTFAKRLRGIRCCAILCRSEMAASMALLSCFAAGVTALPLSRRYGELHCNKILGAISPDAVITDQDGDLQILRISDAAYITPPQKPALIMCTSGTTGTPKGAMLTQENILTNVADVAAYFALSPADTILISRPLYHCAVLTGEFLTALVKGASIRFYSGTFHPTAMLEMIKSHAVTAFCGTPTLLSTMARFKRSDAQDTLRHICISGECMGKETGERIAKAFAHASIYHVYGLTEACPRISYLPPHLFATYTDCVGVPLKSVSLKIVTEDGRIADKNEVGVLWVKGNNVMAGYYNDPAKTAEVLKDGWLCTGDLALINEAGLLKIKGRNDDLIIKAGMNIYPQEIEGALRQDERVQDVYVRGETDERLGTQIVMHVVGDFSNASEVKALCMECLPAYQIPTKVHLLKEMPKNGSGKIIRR